MMANQATWATAQAIDLNDFTNGQYLNNKVNKYQEWSEHISLLLEAVAAELLLQEELVL